MRELVTASLISLAVALPCAVADRNPADNLAENPAFENELSGWRLAGPREFLYAAERTQVSPQGRAEPDRDPLRGKCAKVTVKQGSCVLLSRPIPVQKREPYFLGAFIRTENAAAASVDLWEWDGEKILSPRLGDKRTDVGLGSRPSMMAGTKGWTRAQYVLTPNIWQKETVAVHVALTVRAEGKPATAWFSAVFFARGTDLDHIDEEGWRRPPNFDSLKDAYRKRRILFYAPMEEEGVPALFAEGEWSPIAAENYELVQGKKGKAFQFHESGSRLWYSAPHNFHSSRGTACFWLKRGEGREYYLTVSPQDGTFYGNLVRIVQRSEDGPMQIFMASPSGGKHGAKGIEVAPPAAGRWAHVAFCWDKRFGVKYYLDGELKYSTWGQDAWDYEAVPAGLHLGEGFKKYDGQHRAGSAYDEFYVFDVALTAEEVRALMDDRLMEVSGEPGGAQRVTEVARDAGMRASDSLPVVQTDGSTVFRVVRPVDVECFHGKGKMRELDGDVSTYGRGALDMFLDRPQRISHISVTGNVRDIQVHAWSGEVFDTKRARLLVELHDASADTCVVRTKDTGPVEKLRLNTGKDGSVCELQMLDANASPEEGMAKERQPLYGPAPLGTFGKLGRPPTMHYNLLSQSHSYSRFPYSFAWEIAARWPCGERWLMAADAAPAKGDIVLPPVEELSLFSSKAEADVPLKSVTIELSLAEASFPDVWRITIEDPADQRRPVFQYPVLVLGGGRQRGATVVRLTVDIRDLFLPPDGRLWVRVQSLNGMTVHADGRSALILRRGTRSDVLDEFLVDKLRYCRHAYALRAEGHFWDGAVKNHRRARRAHLACTFQKVYTHLKEYRRFDKENDVAETLWSRIMLAPRGVQVDVSDYAGAPRWAVYQRKALEGASRIAHWWIENKQREDGALGGGLGDDVEMTVRSWPYLSLITGDPKIKMGLKKLADGVWNSGILYDGYSAQARDVQHSAEPSAFSQPHMMAVLYGHPRYVERNLRGISHIEHWSQYAENGKRHIQGWALGAKSKDFSGRGKHRVDVPCNARAVLSGFWVGWYNRHPLVMKWMTEYADAWIAAAAKAEKGKPKWVIPNEVCGLTGELYRYSKHHPRTVYQSGARPDEMLKLLLGMYALTGDGTLLKPFEAHGSLARTYAAQWLQLKPDGPWDQWAREYLRDHLSRNDTALGTAGAITYLVWRADGEIGSMTQSLRDAAEWHVNNYYLMTEAEPSTDRVYAPAMPLLSCMALGYSPGSRNGYPSMACSWQGVGYDTGILIADNSPTSLRVLLYSFREKPADITMRTWRLAPGRYKLTMGPDADGDNKMDRAEVETDLELEERRHNPVPLRLPPGRLVVVELDQEETLPAPPLECGDLAISQDDLKLDDRRRELVVRVHNVGVKPVGAFTLILRDGAGNRLASAHAEGLDWPSDLHPRTVDVELSADRPIPSGAVVEVAPDEDTPEITRFNNLVSVP